MNKKIFLYSVLLVWGVTLTHATHLIGGEMYYDCLGNNQYKITLKIYRDCGPSNTQGTGYDQNAVVGVYNASGVLIKTVNLPFPGANQLPMNLTNPCLVAPPNICVEEAIYTGITDLPPLTGGYDLVYQRCCRNPTILNIVTPASYGNTYWAHVPDPGMAVCNSSPRFKNFPPIAICTNDLLNFDHSATDPDGDVLVYEFCRPYHGGSSGNPAPNPPSPPPFNNIIWMGGFNDNYQITSNPAFAINATTGNLTGMATQQGQYVMGVKVKEYRNGNLLSENVRDFQFNVALCDPAIISSISSQTVFCDGLTVSFQNSSQGSSFYFWNFGDPNSTADTSSLTNPTYTYSDTGTYTVMLVANPSWSCADTSYQTFDIRYKLKPSFIPPNPQCLNGNSFDFFAGGLYDTIAAEFLWNLGINATPPSSTDENPQNVSFDVAGFFPVTLTVSQDGCTLSYTDTVKVYPHPVPEFDFPGGLACQPFTVNLVNQSQAWTNMQYLWNFGDGSTSTEPNPIHTYWDSGTYSVTLIVTTSYGCIDTVTITKPDIFHVFPRPVSSFTVQPEEQSIFQPFFNTYNFSKLHTACTWLFGDGTIIESCDNQFHEYADSGYYPISLITINEFGCTDTQTRIVRVNPEFVFFIPNAFTPDGDWKNEFYLPKMMGVKEYEFYIFDRWGKVLFNTTEQAEGWNGKAHNDSPMPVGVYVYLAKIKDVFGKSHEYIGHVTLIR
ncbi:MAG: PKD domain-containing protein [Bacteroidetes bacterium]|nr:PKD domain-containing protein [Bacteroidota bacterium]MCL4817273.1 PKD domain-containing protein [Flavobacteriales bacterium]NOG95992.1 PKD domain-containing protein [Bacteroidota bacterium]WKZ75394.1 MAG: PKD domain-containing protein [Vicingaceae bacterium]